MGGKEYTESTYYQVPDDFTMTGANLNLLLRENTLGNQTKKKTVATSILNALKRTLTDPSLLQSGAVPNSTLFEDGELILDASTIKAILSWQTAPKLQVGAGLGEKSLIPLKAVLSQAIEVTTNYNQR